MLQAELPGSGAAAVAAAAVGEDREMLALAVSLAALGAPPLFETVSGVLGLRAHGSADVDVGDVQTED